MIEFIVYMKVPFIPNWCLKV